MFHSEIVKNDCVSLLHMCCSLGLSIIASCTLLCATLSCIGVARGDSSHPAPTIDQRTSNLSSVFRTSLIVTSSLPTSMLRWLSHLLPTQWFRRRASCRDAPRRRRPRSRQKYEAEAPPSRSCANVDATRAPRVRFRTAVWECNTASCSQKYTANPFGLKASTRLNPFSSVKM